MISKAELTRLLIDQFTHDKLPLCAHDLMGDKVRAAVADLYRSAAAFELMYYRASQVSVDDLRARREHLRTEIGKLRNEKMEA